MKKIYCIVEKCLACRACEIACAVEHSQSKSLIDAVHEAQTPMHRIRLEQVDGEGRFRRKLAVAFPCRHCKDAPCIEACPEDCILENKETGEVRIDHEGCTGCWICVKACPYGVIFRHRGLRIALKCDHCPGREVPACVEACRTRALVYCEEEEIDVDYADKFKMT